MESFTLKFPKEGEPYALDLININLPNFEVKMGTVFLKAGSRLPEKDLKSHPYWEISILKKGKLRGISTHQEKIFNSGDIIKFEPDELQAAEIMEDAEIIYFLFKSTKKLENIT